MGRGKGVHANMYPHWSGTDYCTMRGAEQLGKMIEAYWAALGHKIETRVEAVVRKVYHGEVREEFGVRSNLINGLPPTLAKSKKAAAVTV